MNNKKYPVSDEIATLFTEVAVYEETIDKALRLPFSHKKVVKLVKEKAYVLRKAWDMIYSENPDLSGEPLRYDSCGKYIEIINSKNENN